MDRQTDGQIYSPLLILYNTYNNIFLLYLIQPNRCECYIYNNLEIRLAYRSKTENYVSLMIIGMLEQNHDFTIHDFFDHEITWIYPPESFTQSNIRINVTSMCACWELNSWPWCSQLSLRNMIWSKNKIHNSIETWLQMLSYCIHNCIFSTEHQRIHVLAADIHC